MRFTTKREAAREWVREFNAIPTEAVALIFEHSRTKYPLDQDAYDYPASWGVMWTFEDPLDEDWARQNIDTIRQCGFLVYDNELLGIVLGIDGGGYDFYESHWIPLYEARGLKWHKEQD